jgi:hypothetical protein
MEAFEEGWHAFLPAFFSFLNGWAQMIRHWMVIFDAISFIIVVKSEFNGE